MTSEDLTGRQLGRYRVISLLGRGGMGAVYRALDTSLDRPVALKVLPPELTSHSDRLQRFVQEARTASALNHPHVVSVYEVGSEGSGSEAIHYMAMELVDGATLRERMSEKHFDLRRAVQIMAQVSDAVAAAHAVGITHRDLKPDNIMISSGGYPKVLDFGLAKLRIREADESRTEVKGTDPGVVMGTVGYMSPEQAQGREADARSDVFSLGCILYELVAGRRAFEGDSTVDTLHKILHSDPARLAAQAPDAPLELQRIVSKALEKDPEDRYQSVKDLAIDLRRLLRDIESNPDLVTVSTSGAHAAVAQPRRNALLWIVAAIAIVALATVAWMLRTRRPTAAETPPISINRITSLGKVISATISPDAKLVAYVVSDEGVQSLWLRQLATGRDLQLIAPDRVYYWSHTFTPDGSSIVYGMRTTAGIVGALYQIPILGGPSHLLLTGMDSPPSFSPNGKQFTYVRNRFPSAGESALMVANADGSQPHVIATRRRPARFAPIFFTGPSWSHDGSLIAAAEDGSGTADGRLIGVDPTTKKETELSRGWSFIGQVQWLPDDSGVVAIASAAGTQGDEQVWLIPRSGKPRRITSDLFGYRIVSLSADGRSLVCVANDAESTVWKVANDGKTAPERLTQEKIDGIDGVVALGDSILYTGLVSGHLAIERRRRGSPAEILTGDDEARYPAVPADGRFFVYVALAPAGVELRRHDLGAGGRESVLARRIGVTPVDVSPDGRWAAFVADGRILRVSTDGGKPAAITAGPVHMLPSISPDGKRVAFYEIGEDGTRLSIVPSDGGAVSWSHPAEAPRFATQLRWSVDGKGLLINTMPRDRANIWLMPFTGEPHPLTGFNDKNTGAFVVAPDGKSLIVSRVFNTRDAVLITNFR